MSDHKSPIAIHAVEAASRAKNSLYPEAVTARLAAQLEGREKRPLGDVFGLQNFGVNLTRLAPGAISALRHAHATQDEFIYVLAGTPTLYTDEGATRLAAGMCAGFKAGSGNGHRLVNEATDEVWYLEVGDRSSGDRVDYPDDDLSALLVDGAWQFRHKDGSAY